uniref:Uncharacterized protein n=1 Tax=Avena sativa TaxID=4498 RepID=A0ACD5TXL0_AVESA
MKKSLKGWGVNLRGSAIREKRDVVLELEYLELIEEETLLTREKFQRKIFIQLKLMKIYEEEEFFSFSRSSSKWLLQGDNNTAYFHRIANGRKSKNVMYSLRNNDLLIQGTFDLLTHAT